MFVEFERVEVVGFMGLVLVFLSGDVVDRPRLRKMDSHQRVKINIAFGDLVS